MIPYGIQIEEDMILRQQKLREYILVLFFVYNKYMKMKRATTENNTAVYGNMMVSYILT